MANFLIVGYIGRGNAGDDVMLVSLADLLMRADSNASITVVADTALPPLRRHLSTVKVVPRHPLQVLFALLHSDVLIWAGGSFLHDVVGRRKYVRQLLLALGLSGFARCLRRRVWLLGVGVGPVKTRWGARLIATLMRVSNVVVTRDSESKSIARSLVPRHPGFLSTLDLSLPALAGRGAGTQLSGSGTSRNVPSRHIGVSLLPTEYLYGLGVSDMNMVDEVKWGLVEAQKVLEPLEVSVFAFNRETDLHLASALTAALRSEGVAARTVVYADDPLALFDEMRRCSAALNMRYHGIVYSFACSHPQVVLAYHPKCSQLAREIGIDPALVLHPWEWRRDKIARALVQACAQQQPYMETLEHASQHVVGTVRDLVSHLCEDRARTGTAPKR